MITLPHSIKLNYLTIKLEKLPSSPNETNYINDISLFIKEIARAHKNFTGDSFHVHG